MATATSARTNSAVRATAPACPARAAAMAIATRTRSTAARPIAADRSRTLDARDADRLAVRPDAAAMDRPDELRAFVDARTRRAGERRPIRLAVARAAKLAVCALHVAGAAVHRVAADVDASPLIDIAARRRAGGAGLVGGA